MQKIHINKGNQATILCHTCGRWKTTDPGLFFQVYKPLRVSCPCGEGFQVIRELRQTYRKQAHLPGTCYKPGSVYKSNPVYVENVSHDGISMHITRPYDLQVDDGIEVSFGLDDQAGSQVIEYGYVKYVQDHKVGVQFAMNGAQAYRKALGFYLLSA